MSRKTIRTPRLTRREKAAAERVAAKQAFDVRVEEASPKPLPRLEPKNARQREAIGYLADGTPVVILTGSAGTGKSMLAAHRVACLLGSKAMRKAYLVRPAVAVGKSIGLLPGEIEEKMAPYFAQTVAHLTTFLGKGYVDYAIDKQVIEMKPAEYLRGMSFEDCVVLVEECQNFTAEEFEMVMTRLGKNCQIIFTGDSKQNDLKGANGLDATIALIDKMLQNHPEYMTRGDIDALDDSIGIVRFTPEDVVRSGLTRAFVKMYYHNT